MVVRGQLIIIMFWSSIDPILQISYSYFLKYINIQKFIPFFEKILPKIEFSFSRGGPKFSIQMALLHTQTILEIIAAIGVRITRKFQF